ncbi:MAG: AP2/ERF family transcription factor [Chloroherpetonaceae bacterium]|nr:AP2/ERF family transcription factor [Chloroherpetonaceae bacterium]
MTLPKGIKILETPNPESEGGSILYGYAVTINRNGKDYRKQFSVKKMKTKEKALEAALSFYNRMMETLPPKIVKPFAAFHSRNQTGVIGVRRFCNERQKGDKIYKDEAYRATVYIAPYKQISKRFSIGKHGEEKAFLLAIEWREEKIQEQLDKYTSIVDPEAMSQWKAEFEKQKLDARRYKSLLPEDIKRAESSAEGQPS